MAKGLKSLIRLGKWNVDEKQRVLGALHQREDQIILTIQQMDQRLAYEQKVAQQDAMGAGLTFGSFYNNHVRRREALLQQLQAVRQQIEVARDELAEAYRELKTYETAEKNRVKRERQEEDRKEQITLDEIGLNLHRRRKAGEN